MVAFVKGILKEKRPTLAVVEVNGIGYWILIPVSTFQNLGAVESQVLLHTHLHVRENIIQLYGFSTPPERELFEHLLSVTGVGPRTALAVLSGMSISEFQAHIRTKNASGIARIPGIGKKTAERLILDLQGKLEKMTPVIATAQPLPVDNVVMEEVILALTSLGYSKQLAQRAIEKAMSRLGESNPGTEALLTQALQEI